MAKVQVGLRLEQDTYDRIESVRGDVPRNRWIERALEAALGDRPERASDVGLEGGGATPQNPASVSRGRITVPLTDDGAWDLEKQTFEHVPAGRRCERCGTVIGSPSLTRHPRCGGKIVPPPS